MKLFSKKKLHEDTIEISFSELISVTGGVIAGTLLVSLVNSIGFLAGLFILYPGLLEMNGNIYTSLAARLSNLLILGKMNTKKELNKFLLETVFSVFFLAFIVSLFLGLSIYFFTYFIFHSSNSIIISASVLSSLLGSLFQIPLTIYITIWVYRHNLDPENIMGPDITTFSDVISIVSLVIAVKVLI